VRSLMIAKQFAPLMLDTLYLTAVHQCCLCRRLHKPKQKRRRKTKQSNLDCVVSAHWLAKLDRLFVSRKDSKIECVRC